MLQVLSTGTSLGIPHRLNSHALPEEAAAEGTQSDSDFGPTPGSSPIRSRWHLLVCYGTSSMDSSSKLPDFNGTVVQVKRT